MSEANPIPASPPASPRQVLLGAFILFQLAFLVVANLLGFVQWVPTEVTGEPKKLISRVAPDFANESGHGWQWADQLETNIRRWTQLTGQDQAWSLFAPSVGKATGFPAVLLIFDEPPSEGPSLAGIPLNYDQSLGFHLNFERATPHLELILSENEPKNIHDFIRTGKCKVRKYEGEFYFNPLPDGETQDEIAARLTRRMKKFITDSHEPAVHYLQWRLKTWQEANPQRDAPKQVILIERFYRIHGPDEQSLGWDGPLEVPMVRWQPEQPPNDGKVTLEPFDYSDQRFTR